jgi:hypothetical protein
VLRLPATHIRSLICFASGVHAILLASCFANEHARATMTAWEVFNEGKGVCRDYAHLAITFCRCMNIPARYCTGYLGDIGVPPPYGPMDFASWFEAYLGGRWYTFDARNNMPRIGRVLMLKGAMRRTCRSPIPSAPTRWSVSRSGRTRSASLREPCLFQGWG